MNNLAIARVLGEIGDLLEIKAENPFKIRAYRNAADAIAHLGTPIAEMSDADRRGIPGIGKDLAGKIAELIETGSARYHQELLQEFPPTILDLLHLQGVGPKTVALLYQGLGIRTLEELELAARDGRIRSLKGMGAKKEALILKALEERQRSTGRRLLVEAADAAASLVAALARARARGRHLARRQPAPRLRDVRRHRHPRGRRAARRSWTPSRATSWSNACSRAARRSRAS